MRYDTRRHLAADARLEALARPDKWYLSAGDGCIWAPPFPLWLHRPGFWDPGHVYHYPVAPLYSVALVGRTGLSDPLHLQDVEWRPDRLVVRWQSRSGLVLTEFRYVLEGGRFCSAWRTEEELGWPNPAFADLWLVAFSAAPGDDAWAVRRSDMALSWARRLTDRREQHMEIDVRLSVEFLPPRGHHAAAPEAETRLSTATAGHCCGAIRSEGIAGPDWDLTPFVEIWHEKTDGVLGDVSAPGGVASLSHAHMALAIPLSGLPARYGVGFVLRAHPTLEEGEAPAPVHNSRPTLPRLSAEAWEDVFSSYPRFSCSDRHLARYFDYRVYGLHLNRVAGGRGRIGHPAIAEGIEYFHLPIAYSAQCHMFETRWSSDPGPARGSLLNFLDNQRDDGSLPGRIYVNHDVGEDFYHANWGDAVLAVNALHPDPGFLAEAYDGLARYARWMLQARDPGSTGMMTVVNHYETGQEYMSRYVAVDPASDVNAWEPRLRLKGVDVTVYAYQLLRALADMAARLDREDEVGVWRSAAEDVGDAIVNTMWDPDTGLFSDVDGATGERTGIKAAVCFYPLLTDLLSEAHVDALLIHLDDPGAFATPFPVPSSSVDDPFFSAEGLWKGKRHNCPWNGRVWPMTNSHVVEGLLRQWQRGRTRAGEMAARILGRFVHMMYHDGDLGRPNCFEHYNPLTGHACTFRGIDDYQHSWVLDLLARGVAGVEPRMGSLLVHPLPMGMETVGFHARARGRDIDVVIEGDAVKVDVDGATHETILGTPLEVPW
jgi:hypothetical protein